MSGEKGRLPDFCSKHLSDFVDTFCSCVVASALSLKGMMDHAKRNHYEVSTEKSWFNKYNKEDFFNKRKPKINRLDSTASKAFRAPKELRLRRIVSHSEAANKTFYCRILDSFEYYLQSVLLEIIVSQPEMMARGEKNSPKFSIPVDEIMNILSKGENHAREIAKLYIEKKKGGAAYATYIKLYNSSKGSKVHFDENILSALQALYEIRNSITHENGRFDEELSKVALENLGIPHEAGLFNLMGTFKLGEYLLSLSIRLENFISTNCESYTSVPTAEINAEYEAAVEMARDIIGVTPTPAPRSP